MTDDHPLFLVTDVVKQLRNASSNLNSGGGAAHGLQFHGLGQRENTSSRQHSPRQDVNHGSGGRDVKWRSQYRGQNWCESSEGGETPPGSSKRRCTRHQSHPNPYALNDHVTPTLLVECLAEYPGYAATLLQLLEERRLHPRHVRETASVYKDLFFLKDELLKFKPEMSICKAHCKNQGCLKRSSCSDFHICPNFVADSCKQLGCVMGHNWRTDHNMSVLKSHFLENLKSSALCKLVKLGSLEGVASNTGRLAVCHGYNDGGCDRGNGCGALHICLNFVVGRARCSRHNCQLNHDLIRHDCRHLLRTYGLSFNETPRDVVLELLQHNPDLAKKQASKTNTDKENRRETPKLADEEQKSKKSSVVKRQASDCEEKHNATSDDGLSTVGESGRADCNHSSHWRELQRQESAKKSVMNPENDTRRPSESETDVPDRPSKGESSGNKLQNGSSNSDVSSLTKISDNLDELQLDTPRGGDAETQRESFKCITKTTTNGKVPGPPDSKNLTSWTDLPSDWEEMQPNDEPYLLVSLSPTSSEYQTVLGLLRGIGPIISNITNIRRIQNPELWHTLQTRIKEMTALYKDALKVDVRRLFYGTKPEYVADICANNFRWKLPGETSGHMFGKGTYFSSDVSYAFRRCRIDDVGNKYLFVGQVALGTMTRGSSTKPSPPRNPDTGVNFDTTTNFMTKPSIFVKHNTRECYPEYIITFSCN